MPETEPYQYQIKTQRLLLRGFDESDAADLYQLNTDTDVMRYTGDQPFTSEESALEFIRNYDHYREHGYGRWAIEDLSNGQFAGFCGLRHNQSSGETDLAFRLKRTYWAGGIGTEAARACLAAGFNDFGLNEITAWAMRENLPSITVLQKLGMKFSRMAEDQGLFWLVYSISADDFNL